MNTKNLKAYAPKARKQFIEAIKKRAAHFGIYEDRIAEVRIEGGAAIIEGRAFTRKEGEQRKRLERKIAERASATYQEKYDMFTREMAYTWFNRLAALRYMEIHDYFDHGFRVLSPANSHLTNADSLPEILNHASDVAESLNLDKDHIIELQLAGDKEEELYRELLLGQCHQLAKIMPQIFKGLAFETIDDATELLLPNNLTKTDSILKGLINDIPEEDWQDIEVIGWLYQFYISEHKNSVIGKVVKSEDIPAATQLFTPNWIVKYLVQNSVGRQWLATYPDSELKGKMEYYIEPAEQSEDVIEQLKAITPTSIDPEEIKVLDPACGSGHILVEVYEVLREIYLERGYRLREIPELIITKNIYGLDIDDRAAQLAGFALMMKAREDDRRIFQRVEDGEVTLNVYSMQPTAHLDIPKLWKALDLEGNQQTGSSGGLFDEPDDFVNPTGIYKEYFELLQMLKSAFLQAKVFGSLISIENRNLNNLLGFKDELDKKVKGLDPAAKQAASGVLSFVNQAICLAQRYDSVVANPPYMGSKGMNADLKEFAKRNFPNSKADLFAIFMERIFGLLKENGLNAQVNMQSWMFLSSYENLRCSLLDRTTFITMAHLGARAFGQISGEVVQTTAWVLSNTTLKGFQPSFFQLTDGNEEEKKASLLSKENRFDQTRQGDFSKIPGSPIAYWFDDYFRQLFINNKCILDFSKGSTGLQTSNSERFLRFWWEVESNSSKWYPYAKGGEFRKWYGNLEYVVNWDNGGSEIKAYVSDKYPYLKGNYALVVKNESTYFKEGVLTSRITSGGLAFRYKSCSELYADACTAAFPKDTKLILGILSSKVTDLMQQLNPTINFQASDLEKIPVVYPTNHEEFSQYVDNAISISKFDWDAYERSKDFQQSPLNFIHNGKISKSYKQHKENTQNKVSDLRGIEERINEIVINSYGLDELVDKYVEIKNVSLTQNPQYRYKQEGTDEREISDIQAELLSYFVGCMMGRYSLDHKGLVYAQSNNDGFKELEADGAYNSFPADDDGVIPLASEEWLFDDDATTRFKEFVKTVWGTAHLSENLKFVAESLCLHALKPKKSESAIDTIRRYFSTQFFKDHCKTYKKRPIYWLFSSGKEKAFECLVYLHRYNEGTLSRMRTEYVTPLMGKYEAQHTLLSEQQLQATGTEARSIEKDLKSLEKKQAELRTFDEQLKHYAEMRITLDLDDGVKANYGKFGNLLADVKAIHGKVVK